MCTVILICGLAHFKTTSIFVCLLTHFPWGTIQQFKSLFSHYFLHFCTAISFKQYKKSLLGQLCPGMLWASWRLAQPSSGPLGWAQEKKIIQGGKLLQINTFCKFDNERIKQGVIQCQKKKINYINLSIHIGQLLRQNNLYQILDWGKKGCTVGNSCSRGSEVVTEIWSRSQKQPNGQRPWHYQRTDSHRNRTDNRATA